MSTENIILRTKDILERMSIALETTTSKALAQTIGVAPAVLSTWKAREKIPFRECAQVANDAGVSLDWLLLGRGSMRAGNNVEEPLAGGVQPAPVTQQNLLDMASATQAMVRVIHEAGGDPIPADLRADLLQSDALDNKVEEPNSEYAVRHIEVRRLAAAAGGGGEVWDETITDHLAFRRTWLDEHGLDPSQCSVIGVHGHSMEPTLPDGCSVLVNLAQKSRRSGHIYVLRTEDGLVVKRLEQNDAGWQLISDNVVDFPPVAWQQSTEIIGEVVWAAMQPK